MVSQSEPHTWKCSFRCSLQWLLQLVIRLQSSRYRAPSSPFLISLPSPPHTAVHRSDVSHTAPPCHGPSSFSAILRRRVTDFLYSLRYFRIFVHWINENGHMKLASLFIFPPFFSLFVRSRVFTSDLNHYAIDADQITDVKWVLCFFSLDLYGFWVLGCVLGLWFFSTGTGFFILSLEYIGSVVLSKILPKWRNGLSYQTWIRSPLLSSPS